MKLKQLSVTGFRGARERLTLRFGTGFTVITGRNGTGKSTVADAIEYALSGSLTKYATSSERQENVSDYIWWRGEFAPRHRSVDLQFENDDGADVPIVRTPGKVVVTGESDIRPIVSYPDRAPADCVATWCRTSILRDEQITDFSIDLSETDRYGFVKNAIGSLGDLPKVETQLRSVLNEVVKRKSTVDKDLASTRERLRETTRSLEAARLSLQESADAVEAIANLRAALPEAPEDAARLVQLAEQWIKAVRLRIETLTRLVARLNAAEKRVKLLSDRITELAEARRAAEAAQAQLKEASTALDDVDHRWQTSSARQTLTQSLASLHEHGGRLGLLEGRCPLCASTLTPEQFAEALAGLKRTIDTTAAEVGALTRARADLQIRVREAQIAQDTALARVNRLETEVQSSQAELARLQGEAREAGVADATAATISALVEELSGTAHRIETDRLTVVASLASTNIEALIRFVEELGAEESRLSRAVSRLSTAEAKVKAAQDDLKRHSASAVDDYLISIEPLLQQLYSRLRPHSEWGRVGYLIRGELRKFLGLVVGTDLNLRFMFSSGQRRAAGIAFLLAVSLARPWARLGTLILDDPVQQVDDFRALHLVETLAGIRQMGKQVVCMVEDPQLANLLARRLRASSLGEGRLIELQYSLGVGIGVAKEQDVVPFQKALLRSA